MIEKKLPPAFKNNFTFNHSLFMIILPENLMNYINLSAIEYLDSIILKKRVLDYGIIYH